MRTLPLDRSPPARKPMVAQSAAVPGGRGPGARLPGPVPSLVRVERGSRDAVEDGPPAGQGRGGRARPPGPGAAGSGARWPGRSGHGGVRGGPRAPVRPLRGGCLRRLAGAPVVSRGGGSASGVPALAAVRRSPTRSLSAVEPLLRVVRAPGRACVRGIGGAGAAQRGVGREGDTGVHRPGGRGAGGLVSAPAPGARALGRSRAEGERSCRGGLSGPALTRLPERGGVAAGGDVLSGVRARSGAAEQRGCGPARGPFGTRAVLVDRRMEGRGGFFGRGEAMGWEAPRCFCRRFSAFRVGRNGRGVPGASDAVSRGTLLVACRLFVLPIRGEGLFSDVTGG